MAIAVKGREQAGFTVLELLLASALGLFVLLAAGELLVSAHGMSRVERSQAAVLEQARFATRLLSQTIRRAGFPGCHPALVQDLTIDARNPASPGVVVGSTSPGLMTRYWKLALTARVTGLDAAGERIWLDQAHGLSPGARVAVSSHGGTHCQAFYHTAEHRAALGRGPGDIRLNRRPDDGYAPISGVVDIYIPETTHYFVDRSVADASLDSLYRRFGSTGQREEMVVGISELELHYGIDIDGDGHAERFVPPHAVLNDPVVGVQFRFQVVNANGQPPRNPRQIERVVALRNGVY